MSQVELTKTGNILTADDYGATSRPYRMASSVQYFDTIKSELAGVDFDYLFQAYDGGAILNDHPLARKFIESNVLMA